MAYRMSARKRIHLYNAIINGGNEEELKFDYEITPLEVLEAQNKFEPLMNKLKESFDTHVMHHGMPAHVDYLSYEDDALCFMVGDRMIANHDTEQDLCDSVVECMKDMYEYEDNPFFKGRKRVSFDSINNGEFSILAMIVASVIDTIGYRLGRFFGRTYMPSMYVKEAYKKMTGREI